VTEAEPRQPPAVSAKGMPDLAFDILVAEDDKANQRLIAALLAEAGCSADVVDNGEAAIEAVTKHRYDLVLMDVAMPLVDGFQAAARIRGLKGEAGEVPIIALTAHVLPGDAERCVAVGMQAHIGKPINRRELLAAIATYARKPVATTMGDR
jgi:CheY-like chemotaxis protein